MHRVAVLELLANYLPTDAQEINFKKQMIQFIKENTDCFERTLAKGHITASAWLLNNDGSKALLMHHAKLDNWFQLGGHCDGDSDVLAVALKEAQEESGIIDIIPLAQHIFDIDIHLIPENTRDKAHYHYDIRFLLQVIGDEKIVQNSESKELRWIEKNSAALPTENLSIHRMFKKWLSVSKRT